MNQAGASKVDLPPIRQAISEHFVANGGRQPEMSSPHSEYPAGANGQAPFQQNYGQQMPASRPGQDHYSAGDNSSVKREDASYDRSNASPSNQPSQPAQQNYTYGGYNQSQSAGQPDTYNRHVPSTYPPPSQASYSTSSSAYPPPGSAYTTSNSPQSYQPPPGAVPSMDSFRHGDNRNPYAHGQTSPGYEREREMRDVPRRADEPRHDAAHNYYGNQASQYPQYGTQQAPYGHPSAGSGPHYNSEYPAPNHNYAYGAAPNVPPSAGYQYSQASSTSPTSTYSAYNSTYGAGGGSFVNPPSQQGAGDQPKPRKRRGNLPKEVTEKLKAWFHAHLNHPYPTESEKLELMRGTGLQMNQISNWFINARRRQLPGLHAAQEASRAQEQARHAMPTHQHSLGPPPQHAHYH